MANNQVVSEVLAQFDREFAMLGQLIDSFNDQQWKEGEEPKFVPARWACHAVQSVDFYHRERPEDFDWQTAIDWEGPIDQLLGRNDFKVYAAMVRARLHAAWIGRDDSELLAPTAFDWTGSTKLGQLLYVLRHMTYHLGEISMRARECGANTSPWQ